MNSDRFGRTQDEVEDHARYFYAQGTLSLKAVSDKLGEITYGGNPISRDDLYWLHGELVEVYYVLCGETLLRLGGLEDEENVLGAYYDTYSDGTPVSTVVKASTTLRIRT